MQIRRMKAWESLLLLIACAAPADNGAAGPLLDRVVALNQLLFGAYNSSDMAAFKQQPARHG